LRRDIVFVPLGGVEQCGIGGELVAEGFIESTELKAIRLSGSDVAPSASKPPAL
jgi:hypothetical protein